MASLDELAGSTRLDGPELAHVQRLIASWGFLADLCFADLLLYVPVAGDGEGPSGPTEREAQGPSGPTEREAQGPSGPTEREAQGPSGPTEREAQGPSGPTEREAQETFLVLGQIRPTTSQTLYREDQVGRVVTGADRPLLARAWKLGQIIDGEVDFTPAGEGANVQCIPVRWKDDLLGVLTRESAPSIGRRPGELERIYVEIFDRFARMIAAGEFPFGAEGTEPKESPRLADGVARLDAAERIDFASPNFVSTLHRMGIHSNVQGARLGELGFEESPVRAAFAIGLPITEEVEVARKGVTVLVRCIPLLERGRVSGALVNMRDVSDLRRRDRLLISKDVTIREMHHRVKNNLQTISSIMSLQGRRLTSPEAKAAIADSVLRIRAIALVHETLSTGPSAEVDFGEIVESLARWVAEGLVSPERRVQLVVEGDAGPLRAEVATPLAVVLAELLQNAVEHGFPDEHPQGGRVVVSLNNDGSRLEVRVHDDGIGLPEGFSVDQPSLGLTIVRTLVANELGGTIRMRTVGGTLVELDVPLIAAERP